MYPLFLLNPHIYQAQSCQPFKFSQSTKKKKKKLLLPFFSPYFIAPCFPYKPLFTFTTILHMIISMKIPHLFLWLLLLLIVLFHEFHNFKYLRTTLTVDVASSSLGHHHQPSLIINHRKALSTEFDFTPFLNRHRHRHRKDFHRPPGPPEIDPRYGVEKRLVPTGPNPLHH